MSVGFNTFRPKTDNTTFVVKNTSSRQIKVFTIKLMPGASYDLMGVPFVSEADIKHSLMKGELRTSLENGKIKITQSSIDLVQYGSDFINFIENSTDRNVVGTRDKFEAVEWRSLRDFPSPVGGVITLSDNNVLYFVYGSVDLGTNRLELTGQNTAIIGRSPRVDMIIGTVTGSSALVTSTHGIQMENVGLSNPDGYAIDINGGGGTDHIMVDSCMINNSKYAGNIGNAMVVRVEGFMVEGCETGLSLHSAEYAALTELSVVPSATSTDSCFIVPPTQTFGNLIISDSFFLTLSASQTGLNIDATTTITNRAAISDNVMSGTGTALAGVTKATGRFWFSGNSGIVDSQTIGGIGFSGNTGTTTISVAGTFVNIGAGNTVPTHTPFALDSASERVSIGGTFPAQYVQYDGYEDKHFNILVALSVATVGAVEKNVASRLLLNGSPIANSEFHFVGKGAGSAAYNLTQVLTNGDQIAVQIANLDDTTAVVVYSARLTLIAT